MKVMEGKLISKGYKFALVVSRFNEFISSRLLEGAFRLPQASRSKRWRYQRNMGSRCF